MSVVKKCLTSVRFLASRVGGSAHESCVVCGLLKVSLGMTVMFLVLSRVP